MGRGAFEALKARAAAPSFKSMNPTYRDAQRGMLPFACIILTHLSGCLVEASSLPGLEPMDGCVAAEDCDAGDACPLPPGCEATPTAIPSQQPPACTEGELRDCKFILGEHGGVTDCVPGVQRCEGGVWSDECTPTGG